MKSIYFYNGSERLRSFSLGLISAIIHSTYIKGKELGYDNIILEWHSKIPYPHWIDSIGTLHRPKNFPIPIKFVRKGIELDCDSIDISKPNSLFDGCSPLVNKISPNCNYLNKYYIETGNKPIFDMPKEKYIVFHYRHSPEPKQKIRNTPIKIFNGILNKLRKEFPDYKFHKIGEECQIDDKFDVVHPYYPNQLDILYNLISKASKFIGGESGPSYIAYMFSTSSIILQDKQTMEMLNKETWKDSNQLRYGDNMFYWTKNNIERIKV